MPLRADQFDLQGARGGGLPALGHLFGPVRWSAVEAAGSQRCFCEWFGEGYLARVIACFETAAAEQDC